MIGASKFVAFYGNDITPTTSFQTGTISENQNGDFRVRVNNSSGFLDITTDKIPVQITFITDISIDWSLSVFADIKELNDATPANNSIISGAILYVPQNKKLTISMRATGLVNSGNANGQFTILNKLNDETIAIFTLSLYNFIEV